MRVRGSAACDDAFTFSKRKDRFEPVGGVRAGSGRAVESLSMYSM
jgi:hypothetical protein